MQKALASGSPGRYGIFMIIRGLVNAAGGVGYHLAALRYSSHLWKPFREDLARELVRRIPSGANTDLVLIGPSGGYCLDPSFLARFRSVLAVDIDPLAGRVLRRRNPTSLRFVRQDFFLEMEKADWDLKNWLVSIEAPHESTVLFSNVLGQLGFLFRERRRTQVEGGLKRALGRCESPWLSFHDRFSVKLRNSPRITLEFGERPSSEALAEAWTAKWAEKNRGLGEVIEHELGDWVNAAHGRFVYLPWRLDSRRTQLIEVCGNR